MQRVSRPDDWLARFTPAAFFVALFFGLAALLALPGNAAAIPSCSSTVTVVSSGDSGAGTLRQAIADVCPGGTINFDAGFSSGGPYTITLAGGELVVSKSMTITGPGPVQVAVSGASASRVFSVSLGVHATIAGLTIRDGAAGAANGGGILSAGVLTVTNSAIISNSASNGGGASNSRGVVTVIGSIFADNRATQRGGGLHVTGTGATAMVLNSTFYSNVTSSMGGAIGASATPVTVTNSTFSGNRAGAGGAVIRNAPGDVFFTNVIMEKSTGAHCSVTTFTDRGGNIADDSSCGFTAPTSRSNTNPMLSPLGNYGGGTQTLAPLPGSPAIDFGVQANCPPYDQRDFTRQVGTGCDSGAVESRGFTLAIAGGSPQTTTIYGAFTEPLSVTVSSVYIEPVGPGGVITFTPPSSGSGLNVTAPFTASTDAAGLAASGPIVANSMAGSYGVTATVGSQFVAPSVCNGGCGATEVVFDLANEPITPSVVLVGDPNPSYFSQSVLLKADVTTSVPGAAAPTGVVTFTEGAEFLGTGSLDGNGQATLQIADLAAGDHTIDAAYGGDGGFNPSTAQAITQTVDSAPTTTELQIKPNSAFYGENVTFGVQVRIDLQEQGALGRMPRPSGALVITDTTGVIDLTGWAVDGDASVSGGIIPAGEYMVYVTYQGDHNFAGSTSQPGTLLVNKHATQTLLNSSSNPVYANAPLRFTVDVGEVQPDAVRLLGLAGPTGAVLISDASGAINLGGSLVGGTVELDAPALAEGTYTVTATYLGDERFAPSVSTALVQVVERHATITALRMAPNPAQVGETVQFTATVETRGVAALTAGGSTGVVAFFANGAPLGNVALANGQALLSAPANTAGVFTVTAVYGGDSIYAPSTAAPASLAVVKRSTGTALSVAPNPSRPGQSVLFTAMVAEQVQAAAAGSAALQPSGQVIFRSDGAEIGRAGLNGGAASLATSSLPVGSHAITAEYVGDDAFAPSSGGPVALVVQPMPLAVNDAAGAQGQPVTINVTANDRDPAGGGLTIVSVTAPGNGSATITPGGPSVLYTPAAGFTGTDSFTYVIQDANGNRDDALVAVVVTRAPEGQGTPQVQAMNPAVNSSAAFTAPAAALGVQAPAGFFTGTLAEKDVLFISFTPVVTPSQETNSPPANLKFGNLEFNLALYRNNERLEGQAFVTPLVITINYDPALIGSLNAGTLGLWYWNGTAWSTDGIVILSNDVTNHTMTVSLSHFSQFAFFAAAPTGIDTGDDEPQRAFNIFLPAMSK